jgi:uncharacterized protein (TIGR00255 family)
MKSMTGYGTASGPLGSGEVIVEIRALNHRYLDVRTTVSADLAPYAHDAERALRQMVARGRYELRLRTTGSPPTALELDVEAARHVYRKLLDLKRELGDATPPSVEAALSVLPEPVRAPRASEDVTQVIAAIVGQAVVHLDEMRTREGTALRDELRASLEAIRSHTKAAEEGCRDGAPAHRDRLRERLVKLVEGSAAAVDPSRIDAEIALLADRVDVTEELVRLESHADQLEDLLANEGDAVGRKLDFLLQELNREANTLAAKCQDAAVTHLAVEIKSEIERMRQQAANVL